MQIPAFYKVDFSSRRKDLIAQALDHMLSQHHDKCLLRLFVAAIMEEVQETFDAIINMQEGRTLAMARGMNLEAIGRIVGEPRAPYQYDESGFMFADRYGQRADSTAVWCQGAPFSMFVPVADEQYRANILARILKNHTLTASVPELEQLGYLLSGTCISYEKTGPMQVRLVLPATVSTTAFNTVTAARTDLRTDDAFHLPFPACLWFEGYITYVPKHFFCTDRENSQQCDHAPSAVGAPYQPGGNYYGSN